MFINAINKPKYGQPESKYLTQQIKILGLFCKNQKLVTQ